MGKSKEQEVIAHVLKKCWEDASFKERLLASSDPISVIEEVTGAHIEVPKGAELVVVDQTQRGKVYLNIPAEPDLSDIELSHEQMEAVAAGAGMMEVKMEFATKPFICIKPGKYEPIVILPPNDGPGNERLSDYGG